MIISDQYRVCQKNIETKRRIYRQEDKIYFSGPAVEQGESQNNFQGSCSSFNKRLLFAQVVCFSQNFVLK